MNDSISGEIVSLEDIISVLTLGDKVKMIQPGEYARTLFHVYEAIHKQFLSGFNWFLRIDSSPYSRIMAELSRRPILLTQNGDCMMPSKILLSLDDSVDGFYNIHTAYTPYLEDKSEFEMGYPQNYRGFLKAIGAYEVRTLMFSDSPQSHGLSCYDATIKIPVRVIEEGYKRTIKLLDEDNRIREFFPSVPSIGPDGRDILSWLPYVHNALLLQELESDSASGILDLAFSTESCVYRGMIDKDRRIIVEIGYLRDTCKHYSYPGYVWYKTANCAYMLDGKQLFPGDSVLNCNKTFIIALNNKTSILYDRETRDYCFWDNEHSYTHFSIPFDHDSCCYRSRYDSIMFSFKECGKGLLLAHKKCDGVDYSAVIREDGSVVLPIHEGCLYYDIYLHRIISRVHDYCEVFDYNGHSLFWFNGSGCELKQDGDRIVFRRGSFGEFLFIKSSYQNTHQGECYYGAANLELNVVFPIVCERIVRLSDDYCRFVINGKCGVLDSKLNVVVPPYYDSLWLVDTLLFCIIGNYVSTDNSILTDNRETHKEFGLNVIEIDINQQVSHSYSHVVKRFEFLLLNRSGLVIEDKGGKHINGGEWRVYCDGHFFDGFYDSICLVNHPQNPSDSARFFIVSRKGKKGIINSKGGIIVPLEYDFIFAPTKSTHLIRLNQGGIIDEGKVLGGNWFYYNLDSMTISPAINADHVCDFSFDYAIFEKGGKFGYIDSGYRIIINAVLDFASDFDNHRIAKVILNGERVIIDSKLSHIGEWSTLDEVDIDNDYCCWDTNSLIV